MNVTDLNGMTPEQGLRAVGLRPHDLGFYGGAKEREERHRGIVVLPGPQFRRMFGFRCDGVLSDSRHMFLPEWLTEGSLPSVVAHEYCHTRQGWHEFSFQHLRTPHARLKAYFFSYTEVEAYLTGMLAHRVVNPDCSLRDFWDGTKSKDRTCPGPRVADKANTRIHREYCDLLWPTVEALSALRRPSGIFDDAAICDIGDTRRRAIEGIQLRLIDQWWHGRKPDHLWVTGTCEPQLFSPDLAVFFKERVDAAEWQMLSLEEALERVGDPGRRLRHQRHRVAPSTFEHEFAESVAYLRSTSYTKDSFAVIAIPLSQGLSVFLYDRATEEANHA